MIQISLFVFCVAGAGLSMAYYDVFVICVSLLVPLGEIAKMIPLAPRLPIAAPSAPEAALAVIRRGVGQDGYIRAPSERRAPCFDASRRASILFLRILVATYLLTRTDSVFAAAAVASPTGIVTYQVSNFGARDKDVTLTFGAIFARGDLPDGASLEALDRDGRIIALQLDRKATHADRSLRHAVITLALAHLPEGGTVPVTLRRTSVAERSASSITPADLPQNFDVVVELASSGRKLTASARTLLARGKPETWLRGPLVSEWWVAGPFTDAHGVADPHLHVRFGIRCYGTSQPLRIDVIVENTWTYVPHPRTELYDAQISLGGKSVFKKSNIVQPAHTRWRKGFWWGEPVAAYVKQNLAYLKKARAVPNYDPDSLPCHKPLFADNYREFETSDRSDVGGYPDEIHADDRR